MIAFLSSTLFSLPELPSVSRTRGRRRFAGYQESFGRASHSPKELKRWIGRWENEGGAIRREAGGQPMFDAEQMRKPL